MRINLWPKQHLRRISIRQISVARMTNFPDEYLFFNFQLKRMKFGLIVKPPSSVYLRQLVFLIITKCAVIWNTAYGFSTILFYPSVLLKGTLSGLRKFLATETPLKLMKIAFCFTLKALFVLKIFKFLSWLFYQVEKN